MRALHYRTAAAKRQEWEADLEARMETVFDRCPELCGFSVAQRLVTSKNGDAGVREWELYVSNIAAYPELAPGQSDLFWGEISDALADLLNHRPDAAELLSGRTFARTWN